MHVYIAVEAYIAASNGFFIQIERGGKRAYLEAADKSRSSHIHIQITMLCGCRYIIFFTRKYPVCGYILGVLKHIIAWD